MPKAEPIPASTGTSDAPVRPGLQEGRDKARPPGLNASPYVITTAGEGAGPRRAEGARRTPLASRTAPLQTTA